MLDGDGEGKRREEKGKEKGKGEGGKGKWGYLVYLRTPWRASHSRTRGPWRVVQWAWKSDSLRLGLRWQRMVNGRRRSVGGAVVMVGAGCFGARLFCAEGGLCVVLGWGEGGMEEAGRLK